MNFVERVRVGHALLDDIEDYIKQWIESDSEAELHDFLGMTKEELDKWSDDPTYLKKIVYGDTSRYGKRGSGNKYHKTHKGQAYGNLIYECGEMHLLAAVLADAMNTILKPPEEIENSKNSWINWKREKEKAIRWMLEDGRRGEYTFSFNNICEVLGIDSSWLRKRVMTMLGMEFVPLPKKKPSVRWISTMNGGEDADDNDYWAMYRMGWSIKMGGVRNRWEGHNTDGLYNLDKSTYRFPPRKIRGYGYDWVKY